MPSFTRLTHYCHQTILGLSNERGLNTVAQNVFHCLCIAWKISHSSPPSLQSFTHVSACCFRRSPRVPQSRGTPSHSAACVCVLSRPPLCVHVGCLPRGLRVLTKAFLSEAIQTFVSLLRRKEARTIRMKMKMTQQDPTITSMNGCF